MKKILSLLVVIVFLFLGCDDKTVDPVNDETFSVEIQVTGENGSPMNNMNVSIWPKIKSNVSFNKELYEQNNAGTTVISYSVSANSFVELKAYDLNNNLKKTLVSANLIAGAYVTAFINDDVIPVYKCVLNAYTDTSKKNLLFTDYIYTVFISKNPSATSLGKTSGEGKLTVNNSLLFPSLSNLSEIPYTNETGPDVLGVFSFSDSVIIAVSNADFSNTVLFTRPVKKGLNVIKLKYSEGVPFNKPIEMPKENGLNKSFGVTLNPDTVGLVSFTALTSDTAVTLNWKTEFEANNNEFEIQRRSSNSQVWNIIGFVKGNGTTHVTKEYKFVDQSIYTGTFYYRLGIIDNDGKKTFSQEVQTNVVFKPKWKLNQNYPNPAG